MDPPHHLRQRNSIFVGVGAVPQLSASLPAVAAAYNTCSSSSSPSSSSESFSSVDFKSISINPLGYTSLKDILPSVEIQPNTAVVSPRQESSSSCGGPFASEDCMRKSFVKQAAWGSYLRPKSAAEDDSGDGRRVVRFWARISCGITGCLRSLTQIVTRTLGRVLGAIRF